MIKKMLVMFFSLGLMASTAAQAASDRAMAPNDTQLAALYWQGHEALKNAGLEHCTRALQQPRNRIEEKRARKCRCGRVLAGLRADPGPAYG